VQLTSCLAVWVCDTLTDAKTGGALTGTQPSQSPDIVPTAPAPPPASPPLLLCFLDDGMRSGKRSLCEGKASAVAVNRTHAMAVSHLHHANRVHARFSRRHIRQGSAKASRPQSHGATFLSIHSTRSIPSTRSLLHAVVSNPESAPPFWICPGDGCHDGPAFILDRTCATCTATSWRYKHH